jgi:integrase
MTISQRANEIRALLAKLDKCKAIAERAKLSPAHFHLRRFRPTYATRMLRSGFDVRTVQHWTGHKCLEATMRYLSPAKDVRERLDKVQIAGLLGAV